MFDTGEAVRRLLYYVFLQEFIMKYSIEQSDNFAFPNRMSPAGTSMFYASFEKGTATNECVGGD